MLVFEAQILKLGLYGEKAEAMGQGGVYIKGFAGDFILLVWRH